MMPSLSARRAWIEMRMYHIIDRVRAVALRKESVDRNINCTSIGRPKRLSLSARRAWIEIKSRRCAKRFHAASLSARRAWIEIPRTLHDFPAPKVALRKESVDRNNDIL